MAILPIHLYGQPVLRKKAKNVQSVDPRIRQIIEDMFETMHGAQGIGLAANQVGLLDRVIVLDISGVEGTEDMQPLVLINPEVISQDGKWVMEEGCLSIPEIREEVERADRIRISYRDIGFREMELEADGLLGRVILHEIDHLNGVLFIDHIGPDRRKLLTGRLNKIERGEAETAYPGHAGPAAVQ